MTTSMIPSQDPISGVEIASLISSSSSTVGPILISKFVPLSPPMSNRMNKINHPFCGNSLHSRAWWLTPRTGELPHAGNQHARHRWHFIVWLAGPHSRSKFRDDQLRLQTRQHPIMLLQVSGVAMATYLHLTGHLLYCNSWCHGLDWWASGLMKGHGNFPLCNSHGTHQFH